MNFDFVQTLQVAFKLFWIIDIIGGLPIILKLRKETGNIHAEKAALVAGALMIVFLFIGNEVLKFMEISIEIFAVAGAFILFILAAEMILGVSFHKMEVPASASIVPIAFPLLAGPGVLTIILSLSADYSAINIIIAIIINILIAYFVMKKSGWVGKLLGETGIVIVHKIAGVILLALSIKLFGDNWKNLL